MKKHIVTFNFVIFIFFSCKESKEKAIDISEPQEIVFEDSKTTTNASEKTITEQYIENDSLTAIMESNLAAFLLHSNFKINKEPIANRHVDNVIDTIITFEQNDIIIESYKAFSEEWIFYAQIKNSNYKFIQSIQTGISRNKLITILETDLKTNLIKIGNIENTSVFLLILENDTLKEIDYEAYMD